MWKDSRSEVMLNKWAQGLGMGGKRSCAKFEESMTVERLVRQVCGPHIFLLAKFKLDCLKTRRRPTYWIKEPRHGF